MWALGRLGTILLLAMEPHGRDLIGGAKIVKAASRDPTGYRAENGSECWGAETTGREMLLRGQLQ